jgi:hypothetical protein
VFEIIEKELNDKKKQLKVKTGKLDYLLEEKESQFEKLNQLMAKKA